MLSGDNEAVPARKVVKMTSQEELVRVSPGSTHVWRIPQQSEPIIGAQIDTGDFVRAFAFARPALEFVHIEPQNEQVQE